MTTDVKKITEIMTLLGAELVAGSAEGDIRGCYVGDLLSDVLASAKPEILWITIQVHRNVVLVASMKDISTVLITSGRKLDPQTIIEAEEDNVTVLSTPMSSYEAAGKLWALGLR